MRRPRRKSVLECWSVTYLLVPKKYLTFSKYFLPAFLTGHEMLLNSSFFQKKEWLYANQCSLFNSWSNLLALQQQALWILFYNCSEASLRIYLCWCTPAVCGLFMNPSELWLFFELLAAWCYWPCCSFITRVPFITPRLTDIVVERDWMQSFMPLPLASGAFQLPSLQDNW